MRAYRAIALLMLAVPTFIFAQKSKKHSDVSAVFMNARYVYVEAEAGDITRPGLYPEDRQAIADAQEGIQDWDRYHLVTRREEADLAFIVRKGRHGWRTESRRDFRRSSSAARSNDTEPSAGTRATR